VNSCAQRDWCRWEFQDASRFLFVSPVVTSKGLLDHSTWSEVFWEFVSLDVRFILISRTGCVMENV